MSAPDAEVQMAIINAIDAWVIGQKSTTEAALTKRQVLHVVDSPSGRRVEEEDQDRTWSNPADVAAELFLRSLRRSGYHLVRAE